MKIHHFTYNNIVAYILAYAALLPIPTSAFIHGGISARNRVVPTKWGLKSWKKTRRGCRFPSDAFAQSLSAAAASASSEPPSSSASGDDELDEERKASLFQFLLRDLQVEGVPLLAVDSNQVETLQAAVWTTMAELIDNNNNDDDSSQQQQKVCLVFEEIPMTDLRVLVDDFVIFKKLNQILQALPELERVSLSLLGKGKVGPAMILEVVASNATKSATTPTSPQSSTLVKKDSGDSNNLDEIKYTAAMKAFSSRLLDQMDIYPYNQQKNENDIHVFNTAYRFCSAVDVSHIMSSFWNCICELTANPDTIATTVLVLPGLQLASSSQQSSKSDYERFATMTQLMSRSLCLFRGNDVYELVYYSPTYNRDEIHPAEEFVHGHLPPRSWIQSILCHENNKNNNNRKNDVIDMQELEQVWDYQRRSPVPAVVIKRVALLQQNNNSKSSSSSIVDLELPNRGESGKVQQQEEVMLDSSDIATYMRNALYLTKQGKEALHSALELEMSIFK